MNAGKGMRLLGAFFVGVGIGIGNVRGEEMSKEQTVRADAEEREISWDMSRQVRDALSLRSLDLGLFLEAEGSASRVGSVSESDLNLATAEFTLDAEVNEWLSGHLGLLWEENDTETNNLDEAYFTIGQDFYLQAGRYYLPFGDFASAFISDPLTLELAEMNQSAVQVGYRIDAFHVCAGAFRGADETSIETGYAAAGASLGAALQVGAYWLSDLLETDGLSGLAGGINQTEGGAGVYANLCCGPATVNAEWVSALSEYKSASGNFCPMAYNFEASLAVDDRWAVGAKWEGSNDFYTDSAGGSLFGKFHECGYGTVISCALGEHASVSTEYLRVKDLDDGDDGHLVTLQFAFEI
ncbi:MAG: LbtU family siderophore porin [Pontiellaceae bacterium]|nr:LbtU family siderophore porin [Pontiellaceae bacterium]